MTENDNLPWFRRTYRWGQTNLTELDPSRYDSQWWREHWRRTRVQGVIINAGGIVAFYPSKFPLHHRAEHLGDRDLYGEINALAREEGLVVLARMDSNRADERFFNEHPDWFTRDANGDPYMAGPFYVSCVHGPYYDQFLPDVLKEIIDRYQPDGFADNSWSGLTRDKICYCNNCSDSFHRAHSKSLPQRVDWDDPVYRNWIQWNYQRRLEIWELNNKVTKEAGGDHCLWIGMNSGSLLQQSQRFRDYKGICERSEIVLLDSQTRLSSSGFQINGDMGKLVHGLIGWDRLIPESMAMYQSREPTFRLSSRPAPEARMWAVEGFAGTIQPWWHHISAYHEDRRQYRTAESLFRWHETNERYLVDRRPIATVGIVWSQQNIDFYGRDEAEARTVVPYQGFMQALIRARIPYIPIHADHIEREADKISALVLPNVGALSEDQCQTVRRFVNGGGGLVATGESSRYDELGNRRDDFALADLFGAHASGKHIGSLVPPTQDWEEYSQHSYLRIVASLRSGVYGPVSGGVQDSMGIRHPALSGFEETDVLPFGGRLEVVTVDESRIVPLTFIPPFPIFPPETSWMREPESAEAALILNEEAGGRVAYLPASVDYCFGRYNLPDHGDLLANLVRWASSDRIPIKVKGVGLIDCHLYQQDGRVVLHLVNLTSAGTWRTPVHELIPVGPYQVEIQLPEGIKGDSIKFLVAEREVAASTESGWSKFEIPSVLDHEVCVIS